MAVRIPKNLEELPVGTPRWVGRPVTGVEDHALVTGQTEFTDNVALPGMLHCAILRSPYAHARISNIDVREAERLPGVMAVVTGADAQRWTNRTLTAPPDWGSYCLAVDKVRFVGEPIAAVAATSRYLAEDALELIEVEYAPLPPVVDACRAAAPGSPLLFEEKGTNVMYHRVFTWGALAEAFGAADHVFTETFRWHRAGANAIETFGVISQWDPVGEAVTCRGSYQAPAFMAAAHTMTLRLPSHKIRFISQPRGGSFGGRGGSAGTDITALLSRQAGGRPVKWIEDRIEYLSAGGSQAWDRHYEASIAVKRDGTVTGLKIKLLDDSGATAEGFGPVSAIRPLACFTGCYAIAAAEYDLTVVATNKLPCGSYRGMGVPPHYFVVEQMLDIAAEKLSIDPADLRRRNFIRPDRFPYTIASGNEYDSGNYEAALDKVLRMADYQWLREAQAKARADGRHIGVGVATSIEPGVFSWNLYALVGVPQIPVAEGVTVSIDMHGKIVARVGFTMEGQGQYTVAAQVLADYFGVEIDAVRVVAQDTLSAPPHFGPGGSRLGVALTGALLGAAELLKDKLARVVARFFQTDPANVDLRDGRLRVKGVPGAETPVAEAAAMLLLRADLLPPDMDPNPQATYLWSPEGRTPVDEHGRAKSYLTAANACHVAVVEIDAETGVVKILNYFIVDDCGTRLNPVNLEGMIHGGLAQGVGMALLEEYVYGEDGQLLTSTFMDYLLPTIADVPTAETASLVTPSPFTPLGAKGMGEAAIQVAPAAILCAINDALRPMGVRVQEVPATPQRIWELMRKGKVPPSPSGAVPALP
ncbi:MAG: xanthine dehydrogenase family protein molybdopterin-binding subunit [Candidatus Binatia bacterium]